MKNIINSKEHKKITELIEKVEDKKLLRNIEFMIYGYLNKKNKELNSQNEELA